MDLPERHPSHSTCHQWLMQWAEDGTWERIRMALIEELGCANELELEGGLRRGELRCRKKKGAQ